MLPTSPKVRVLIVDDERVIADTLAIILGQNGYETAVAYSGEQALEMALGTPPRCLIADIVMGKMNGLQAAVLIQKEVPDCKVLLFSGQPATSKLLDEARKEGHQFEVIAKPVHPTIILDQMKSLFWV